MNNNKVRRTEKDINQADGAGKEVKSVNIKETFKFAFPKTLPVMAGYIFLGISYGILMKTKGFGFRYPVSMAAIVYGGSLEFVMVDMLMSKFNPVQSFLLALMIQARHIFYGLSMLDKYNDIGGKKIYVIFAMSDETFSINCSTRVPANIDKGWFYFFVSLFDHFYWVFGAGAGWLIGSLITFNTEGLDFVMTAMFTVILLDKLFHEKKHYTAVIGALSSISCLLIFGADNFLIPTMAMMLILLIAFRKPIEKAELD